jgi:hypothetical protein
VILSKSGITNVPDSLITGDIACSPITGNSMTGFNLTMSPDNTYSTSPQITGKVFAADYTTPTPTILTAAVSAMEAAYTDLAGRPAATGARLNLGGGILGLPDTSGNTPGGFLTPLTEGTYTFSTGVTIFGDIYFDGDGNDIFIIQITGNLVQASGTRVHLLNGVKAKNIYWQVAGAEVAVGTTAHMKGILVALNAVHFRTGSSLDGRVMTQKACTLDTATITAPAP